jgi:predicted Rossmann-fold nucleotide-binding protein
MDEFFESMTLIQTEKTERFPVILVGSEFWNPLADWMRTHQLGKQEYISPSDLDLFQITDDVDWAAKYLAESYKHHLAKPAEPAPDVPAAPWTDVTAEGTTAGKRPQPRKRPKGYEDLAR